MAYGSRTASAALKHHRGVKRVGDRLADIHIRTGRILTRIENQILGHGVVILRHVECVISFETSDIGSGNLSHVNFFVFQRDASRGGLGDTAENNLINILQLRIRSVLFLPVVAASLHCHGGASLHVGYGVSACSRRR